MAVFCVPHTSYCFTPLNIPQELLTWHDALAIAAIIFAITQFMETTRLRRYLFYFGWLRKATVILTAIPILSVMIANAPPIAFIPIFRIIGSIINWYYHGVILMSCVLEMALSHIPVIHLSKNFFSPFYSLVGSPMTYEVLGLLSFSLLLLLYLTFLMYPEFFKPIFGRRLLDSISHELLDNLRQDDIAALCKIISLDLEKIIKLASQDERILPGQQVLPKIKNKELAVRCHQFIDVDLSGENFIEYIARYNIRFVHNVIVLADQYRLWEAGGDIFFDNLFSQLLTEKTSVLTREHKFGGYSGVAKPLFKLIFTNLKLIAHYNPFQAFDWGSEVSDTSLSNWLKGLDMSLRTYYKEQRVMGYSDMPNMQLAGTIEKLGECFYSMCVSISSQDKEIWKNTYGSKISRILGFFQRLEFVITPVSDTRWEEPYNPVFSQEELTVQKYTIAEGIVEGLFKVYEGLAVLKNEEYARMMALDPYWLVISEPQGQMMKAIQDKFLEKIKARVDENFKSWYASMTKLFLSICGADLYNENPTSKNPIVLYFREIFKTRIIPELRKNDKYRQETMPSTWVLEKDGTLSATYHEGVKIVIDKVVKNKKQKLKRK